mmetsp:Transcript_46291/g.93442  ORF Transcript_46291/g.93442 Transcript_46291/m.93442 type:complete len:97 (+) Transcript_46291:182-472(+)
MTRLLFPMESNPLLYKEDPRSHQHLLILVKNGKKPWMERRMVLLILELQLPQLAFAVAQGDVGTAGGEEVRSKRDSGWGRSKQEFLKRSLGCRNER